MKSDPIVYVVDDDISVSKALGRLFRVAGLRLEAFATAQDFLDFEGFESPSCLVLDVQLPDRNGLDLQQELKARGRAVSIVFITGHGDVPTAVKAMREGAVHFLSKPFDNRELLAAVQQAIRQQQQELDQEGERERVQVLLNLLTPREREVFFLVASGMPNKNIAAQLDVSLQSIKLYRGRVMEKLRLESAADLVRLAEMAKSFHTPG
jgi:RNA polymerase sigma factor (sigma-70 family)